MNAPKILIVEDNVTNSAMLSRRLSRKGFEVRVAADGREALTISSEYRPDVVLMDMSLPVLDGWEATRRLKADPETAAIRVIALTAHAMVGEREKALEAGCDDYDTKPVDLNRLLLKLNGQLGRTQSLVDSV